MSYGDLENTEIHIQEPHLQTQITSSSHDIPNHSPREGRPSVMREFLDCQEDFTWPPGLGNTSGSHCNLGVGMGIPLLWKKMISDKKASIDLYEVLPDYDYGFKKPFIVKTIRESSSQKARDAATNEVNTMRDLRHPHITALLATFVYHERLSILIFPVACCDLHQFMKQMSKDIQLLDSPANRLDGLDDHKPTPTRSDGTTTTDSTPSVVHHHQGPNGETSEKRTKCHHGSRHQNCPLKFLTQQKKNCLRRYFVCLSEALKYLHESGVRHKDIKPENILIDESGSVILTDFGISRRFGKDTSHVTNNEWRFTRKYASPEVMKGKFVERDDPSDVFSLGCVFLEMATLLLEEDLDSLAAHYTTTVNQTSTEEAYHCNLQGIYKWIDRLQTKGVRRDQEQLHRAESVLSQDHASEPEQSVIESLTHVRKMLDEDPQRRPKSRDLWACFQSMYPEKCRDCDPRSEERWKPSTQQQQNSKAGLDRRSMMLEVDVNDELTALQCQGIDSSLLLPTNPTPTSRNNQATNFAIARPSSPATTGRQQGEKMARHEDQRPIYSDLTDRPHDQDPSPLQHVSANVNSPQWVPNISRTTNPPLVKESINVQGSSSPMSNPHRPLPTTQPPYPAKLTNRNEIAQAPAKGIPLPDSQILVYDVERRRAYKERFGALGDRDYRRYPLPRTGQRADVGEKAELIAKVDLGSLGFWVRARRMLGKFPQIYVLNHTSKPVG